MSPFGAGVYGTLLHLIAIVVYIPYKTLIVKLFLYYHIDLICMKWYEHATMAEHTNPAVGVFGLFCLLLQEVKLPLPTPNDDESADDFISRCMSDSVMTAEYTDIDQRLAVCSSLVASSNKSKAILIKSQEERIVLGAVYVPESIDSDGETMTREDVQRMAHDFLSSGRVDKIDIGHSCMESGNKVIESFVARDNDPDFIPGTWVLGIKINNDDDWIGIKKGELNAFSFFGAAKKESKRVLVEIVSSVSGTTKAVADGLLPEHEHDYYIEFDDSGEISKGQTAMVLNHRHSISAVDATDITMDHAHRINISEE